MVAFASLAEVWRTLAGTRSRNEKIRVLTELLRNLAPEDVATAVGFLVAEPRVGAVGLGPATLWALHDVPAPDTPSRSARDVESALAALRGKGDAEIQAEARSLFATLTRPERDFLVGSLTSSLRQGGLDGIMLRAIADAAKRPEADVRRAAMVMGNAARVAEALFGAGSNARGVGASPHDAPLAAHVTLFTPVSPMLASTAENVNDALAQTKRALVECKMDGVRAQVHRGLSAEGEPRVAIFSRAGKPLQAATRRLEAQLLAIDATSFVIDAEILMLDAAGRPIAFQDTFSAIAADPGDEASAGAAELVLYAFDCIHHDGEDLLDHTLEARRERLAALVPESLVMPCVVAPSVVDASTFYDLALAGGHEGVMVKDLDSPYAAGTRSTTWIKVKHVHTADLVILAAEWGSGRRQGFLSNLHLGARRDDGSFCMVGKTFKGLTDAMLREQTEKLLTLEERRTDHVVWVRPELIVEVAFNDVQRSPRYPGGVALRFARVKRYRTDKDGTDVEPLAWLQKLAPGAPAIKPKRDAKSAAQEPSTTSAAAKPQLSLFDSDDDS